eukprot:Em0016g88a
MLEKVATSEKERGGEGVAVMVRDVRTPDQLGDLDGLIIPGGESTTLSVFLKQNGFEDALRAWIRNPVKPGAVWGTCAGLILLSDELLGQKKGGQASVSFKVLFCFPLGGLSVLCCRNAYGRQSSSFEAPVKLLDPALLIGGEAGQPEDQFHGIFIRAPWYRGGQRNQFSLKGMFSSKRYLAFSKKIPAPKKNLLVVSDKDPIPLGYDALNQTFDDNNQVFHNKQLLVKYTPLDQASCLVVDIRVLSGSQRNSSSWLQTTTSLCHVSPPILQAESIFQCLAQELITLFCIYFGRSMGLSICYKLTPLPKKRAPSLAAQGSLSQPPTENPPSTEQQQQAQSTPSVQRSVIDDVKIKVNETPSTVQECIEKFTLPGTELLTVDAINAKFNFNWAELQLIAGMRLENMLYNKIEDTVYHKLDKHRPTRSAPHEQLGTELNSVGSTVFTGSPIGSFMIQCSEVETKLGQADKQFQEKVQAEFITPLKAFLEVDIKAAVRERKVLNVRRVDLDVAKAAAAAKKPEGEKGERNNKPYAAEERLRNAQTLYDTQLAKVRDMLNTISEQHSNNLGHLPRLLAAQKAYYTECVRCLGEIDIPAVPGTKFRVGTLELDSEDTRRARVLYDYDANGFDELSVSRDQEIEITPIPDNDEFVMAKYEGKYGKIPSTYVEKL